MNGFLYYFFFNIMNLDYVFNDLTIFVWTYTIFCKNSISRSLIRSDSEIKLVENYL